MKSKGLTLFLTIALLISFFNLFSQDEQIEIKLENGSLFGTLTVPNFEGKCPVVLIIAGSGPTDRDGNQIFLKNNSLKYLAEGLFKANIATLRFDKRGIGASQQAGTKEEDVRFDHLVNDAILLIEKLKTDNRFSSVFVAGHSEGSLIGMVACNRIQEVSGFVSIAGAGRPADIILKEQLASQPPIIKDYSYGIIDKLKSADTVSNISPLLMNLFRPSVQPYLISWFKYDPAVEISTLSTPKLVIQGVTDIQVSVADAELLKKAAPDVELVIIENMNHVLKESKSTDRNEQMKNSYTKPDVPIMAEPVNAIVEFINKVIETKP